MRALVARQAIAREEMNDHAKAALLALVIGLCFGIGGAAVATAVLVIFGIGPDWIVAIWAGIIGLIAGTVAGWDPK